MVNASRLQDDRGEIAINLPPTQASLFPDLNAAKDPLFLNPFSRRGETGRY